MQNGLDFITMSRPSGQLDESWPSLDSKLESLREKSVICNKALPWSNFVGWSLGALNIVFQLGCPFVLGLYLIRMRLCRQPGAND
jgi:hypothetical protein